MKMRVLAGILVGLMAAMPVSGSAAPCQIAIAIHDDGAVVLDGATYSIEGPLFEQFKTHVSAYYARDHKCAMHLDYGKSAPPRVIGTVALTLDNLRLAASHR